MVHHQRQQSDLSIRIGSTSSCIGESEVVRSDDIVERRGFVSPVLVNSFVNDIPGVDFALPVGHQLRDVVLHDTVFST